ncbi:hypothetical protein D3C81_2335110 [compost metagenome]
MIVRGELLDQFSDAMRGSLEVGRLVAKDLNSEAVERDVMQFFTASQLGVPERERLENPGMGLQ